MEKEPQIRDLRNGDWLWINKLVLDHPYLTASAKVVYSALAYFANNNTQKSFPSIKTIMKLTGLGSRTTIVNSIKTLEEYKFIRTLKNKGRVNEYILLKLTDSRPVHKLNQSIIRTDQSIISTGVVHNKHTNNTNLIILNKKNSSFKKNKPFFRGQEMRRAQGMWWVLPIGGGKWLEFAGLEKEIEWK